MNPANPADATSCTARGHGSSLAHVPAGQLLRDVEGLPDIRVVEVGGGGGGVGAGGDPGGPCSQSAAAVPGGAGTG